MARKAAADVTGYRSRRACATIGSPGAAHAYVQASAKGVSACKAHMFSTPGAPSPCDTTKPSVRRAPPVPPPWAGKRSSALAPRLRALGANEGHARRATEHPRPELQSRTMVRRSRRTMRRSALRSLWEDRPGSCAGAGFPTFDARIGLAVRNETRGAVQSGEGLGDQLIGQVQVDFQRGEGLGSGTLRRRSIPRRQMSGELGDLRRHQLLCAHGAPFQQPVVHSTPPSRFAAQLSMSSLSRAARRGSGMSRDIYGLAKAALAVTYPERPRAIRKGPIRPCIADVTDGNLIRRYAIVEPWLLDGSSFLVKARSRHPSGRRLLSASGRRI